MSARTMVLVSLAFVGCKTTVLCEPGFHPEGPTCVPDEVVLGPPTASIDPCPVEFGEVDPGVTSSQTVTIVNSGGSELVVSTITMDAPWSSPAHLANITANSKYQFQIHLDPTTYGDLTGKITITSNDPANPTLECELHATVTGDADGDGFIGLSAGGDDCDDTDPAIYPGAPNTWYNGIDESCSGLSDYDQDMDGYESEAFNPDATAGGGDCQDRKADIHPGAIETYYDGVDQDCDGQNDYDKDGDGEKLGTDCDDEDASVSSTGVEAYDGRDNDCDGTIDDGVLNTEDDMTITGSDITQAAGSALAIGDFDDDGENELVIGLAYYNWSSTGRPDGKGDSGGAVAVFSASDLYDGAMTDSARAFFEGEETVDELGTAVANLGDVDEDGIVDLAIGAASRGSGRSGSVYLFSGEDALGGDLDDAFAIINGYLGMRFGSAISSRMDLDGDGAKDLVAFGVDTFYPYGYIGLQYGGSDLTGEIDWTDVDASWHEACGPVGKGSTGDTCLEGPLPQPFGGSPYWTANGGSDADFNGDGYSDVLMADPYWDKGDGTKGQANHGRVWVLAGRASRYATSETELDGNALDIFTGETHKQFVGQSVGVVPVDAAGTNGVLVQDPDAEELYYFHGTDELLAGSLDLQDDAAAVFDISAELNGFVNIGDWTADGYEDLAILSKDESQVTLLETGGWSGVMGDYDASTFGLATIVGDTGYEAFGTSSPAFAGDLDGDALPDLVVGDYSYDDERGSVHIFFQPE